MLWKASGAEEAHAQAGEAIGLWYGAAGISIDNTVQYTGNYGYKLDNDAAGGTNLGPEVTQAWWSFEFSFETVWGDGSYYYLFRILAGGEGVVWWLGWTVGSSTSQARLALFSDNVGTVLAQSSAVQADQLDQSYKGLIKLEYDDGEWTAWGQFSNGWEEQFTYSEPSPPAHVHQNMTISSWTDETKGAGFFDRCVDDVHCWDNLGDNWNSKIATMSDFPRISLAHVPDDDAVWVALDAVNHATHHGDLDEIPPDHASMVDSDEADYFTSVGDLYDTTDTALLPDLSEETIQALLVTHAAYDVGGDLDLGDIWLRLMKYNIYEDATGYYDSEEDGREVMQGHIADYTARTAAGYYPWTPGLEENWTETNFNACEYGIDIMDGLTDQMTVQVIFFGTGVDDWEWTPPVVGAARRIFIT